jgi:8-oxo-dGTP pyrophosphatase MutT (NUDIX family)
MSPLPTANAISAGGVVYRKRDHQTDVALILVGPKLRWQLPKGTVNTNEKIEQAALREVREETGLQAELLNLLERIEYWFYATQDGQRVRFHKFVHFFLMRFISGNVSDHDQEVEEARWVEINEAIDLLAFESEKKMVRKTRAWVLKNDSTGASQDLQPNQPKEDTSGA